MEQARPVDRLWSRAIWILVTVLTGIGMIGVGVDFLGLFASGPLTGGCAMAGVAALLMLGAFLLVAGYLVLIAGLVMPGLILFWRRSRWGPRLLIPANLLAMAFFILPPVGPGYLAWAVVLVLLAAAPTAAVVLLFWALLSRGSESARIADLVVLGALALPLTWACIQGLSVDVSTAMTPAPQLVAQHGCGGSSSLLPAVLKVLAP
jgi:hypothetical protein